MKKVTKKILLGYRWVKKNLEKLILIGIIYGASTYLLNLPYINLLRILFSFFPFIFSWIAILILFKPKKENILKLGFILLIIAIPLSVLSSGTLLETIGNLFYLFVGTYVLYSLKEMRS